VSARARQLSYRLKNRRTAIVSRRQNDASLKSRSGADVWRDANGRGSTNGHSSNTSPSGFAAVNVNRREAESEEHPPSSQFTFSHSNTENVTIINGTSIKGASPTTRAELMKKFFTTADRHARGYEEATGPANPQTQSQPLPWPRGSDPVDYSIAPAATTPVAIPGTPSSLLPPPKTTPSEKDDGGPFKLEMVARMEELGRGERVIPPCDRCRRLHMDCLKNLTACMGCTKKHAKCSWRDVKEEELRAAYGPSAVVPRDRPDEDRTILPPIQSFAPSPGSGGPRYGERALEVAASTDPHNYYHSRRESAPGAPYIGPGSGAFMNLPPSSDNSPRRAMSDEGSGRIHHEHSHPQQHRRQPSRPTQDDVPDANQRLMQAILDTVDHHARVAAAVQEKERGAERSGDGNDRDAEKERGREREREREGDRDRDRDRDRRLVQA